MEQNNKEPVNTCSEGSAVAQVEVGSRAWLLETQIETFEKIIQMTKRKNADYAGKGGDAFNNFTRVEGLCPTISTEEGFFVRLTDKFSRIGSFIQNGELQVKDESVEDTLLDLSNYAFLFYAFLRAKKLKAAQAERIDKARAEMAVKAIRYDQDQKRKENDKCEAAPEKDFNPTKWMNGENRNEIYKSPEWDAEAKMKAMHEDLVRLEKNNAQLAHECKRLARENVAYKHLGTPTQIQILFNKVDQVLNEKMGVETHADGVKSFVSPTHKSMIDLNAGANEGGCDEKYPNNGLEHN